MKPLQPWGAALKYLLEKTGQSQNEVVKRAEMDNNEFYRMCRGERGPGVRQLGRILEAMSLTWHDWAKAYESVRNGTETLQKGGSAKPYATKTRKVG